MSELTVEKKFKIALLKSISGRYVTYGVQLVSMMVLARIFTPEIFGVFAIIQVFSVFFLLFSEMGIGPALINEESISVKMRDGLFSVTWLLGMAVAVIFVIFSPLISWFYENTIYELLVYPVAASIVFSAGSIVPLAALEKDQKFISVAWGNALAELGSLCMVLASISYLDPVMALAVKPLTLSIFRFFLLWGLSVKTVVGKAIFGSEFHHVRKIIRFSAYQFAFNFLNYFSRNLDNVLVGKALGATSLGIYDKAYQLMRYPLMLLTFAMSPAIQPVLAQVKKDKCEFERLHNKFVKYISLLGLFIGVGLYFSAGLIVNVLLGKQWIEVIPLIEILSLTIPFQIVASSSGGFFQAAGRADLLFYCGIFSAATNVTAIILGVVSGTLEGLCWAIFFSFSINFLQCYWLMGRTILPGGFRGVLNALKWNILGTTILGIWIWYPIG